MLALLDAVNRSEQKIDRWLGKAQPSAPTLPRDPFRFRGAAEQAQRITAHEWMLAGPAETGKTVAGLWRLDDELSKTRKAQASLVRKVAADIGPTVLATYRKVVERSGSGAIPFGGSKPEWYDYPNGARLYIGGMDRPGKTLSGERDFIYVNQAEELHVEDWETLTTRATGRGAVTKTPMIFGDCNPAAPGHWIINRPTLNVLYSRHEDNPTLYTGGELTEQGRRTMAVLDALTGIRHKRLRLGLWVSAEGVVYEEYDRSVHLIEPFPISKEWRRFRVVDFGYTNPFVCQWWAVDHDGNMYLYREWYMTQMLVEEHAAKIKELSEPAFFEATVCDHDAEDRATLEKHGIPTVPAAKSVSVGIQAVQSRLKSGRIFIMRGALVQADQRLLDAKKPVCTEQEIEGYMWHKGADGKPNKEEPVKVDDHGVDGLRYGVMYAESFGVPLRRSRRAA
jgi:PBSX family phage terminase large subunit